MNCYQHTDTPAVAFCRTCGKGLCVACKRESQGTVFCEEHVPAAAQAGATPPAASPYVAPATQRDTSPALALILGFAFPGVGAIYNGQYAKGLVHAIIFGVLISILSSNSVHGAEPLFAILLMAWVAYMGLEAYSTAKRRQAGEAVDEFSSIVNLRSQTGMFPTGAVVLIVIGVIMLLHTLDVFEFHRLVRYWPALLIFIGVAQLLNRSQRGSSEREAGNEQH